MGFKKLPSIAPQIHYLYSSYSLYLKELNQSECPELWHKFLKSCGLVHTSLSRIEIVNKKKWFLAKIKYGI